MNVSELVEKAQGIATLIPETDGPDRFALHDQLHRTLETIRRQGGTVPRPLSRLDLELVDEAVEASFDNMPV
ncbi:MAG: hypothetical protein ACRBBO_00580 [Cognatishimia sp.]